MSRADGVLDLVLEGHWWLPLAARQKREEYRAGKLLYARKLLAADEAVTRWACGLDVLPRDFFPYRTLRARWGYTSDPSRIVELPISGFRWGKPRPEWCYPEAQNDCWFCIGVEP